MGKKSQYSIETKIKACKNYEKGKGSFQSIAEELGVNWTTLREWYFKYREHGVNAFDTTKRNNSYTKEFKLEVIEEYITNKGFYMDLAAKYNIDKRVVRSWLKKWYNDIEIKDYMPKEDVYTMKSRKTTFEERLDIVKWVIQNNMSYKDAADRYAITYALVYKWTRAYIDKGADASRYQKQGPKPKSEVDENDLTEVELLKLELERERALRKRREFELEVLKKKEELERKLPSRK